MIPSSTNSPSSTNGQIRRDPAAEVGATSAGALVAGARDDSGTEEIDPEKTGPRAEVPASDDGADWPALDTDALVGGAGAEVRVAGAAAT